MCNLVLNKRAVEDKYAISFDNYFADALENLLPLEKDGLIELGSECIYVPEHARIYIRAICARFDAYLNTDAVLTRYSKAI